jgi:hypothetical protein
LGIGQAMADVATVGLIQERAIAASDKLEQAKGTTPTPAHDPRMTTYRGLCVPLFAQRRGLFWSK